MTFGNITDPFSILSPTSKYANKDNGAGLFLLLQNLLLFVIVIAGLYTFWNLILAGFMFLSAGEDSKAVGKAWAKIWQSIIGLLVVAASFIIAGVFGYLIFGDATALITPQIFGPGP